MIELQLISNKLSKEHLATVCKGKKTKNVKFEIEIKMLLLIL